MIRVVPSTDESISGSIFNEIESNWMGIFIEGEINPEHNDAMLVYYPSAIINGEVYYMDCPIMEEDYFSTNEEHVILTSDERDVFSIIRNMVNSFKIDSEDPSILRWKGIDGHDRQVRFELNHDLKICTFSDHDDSFEMPIYSKMRYTSYTDLSDEYSLWLSFIKVSPVLTSCMKPKDSKNTLIAVSLSESPQPDEKWWIGDMVGMEPIDNRYER